MQQYVDYDALNGNDSDNNEDDDVTNATPGAPPHMNHVVRVQQTQLLLTGTQTLDPEKFTSRVQYQIYGLVIWWWHYQNLKCFQRDETHLLQSGVVVPTFERRYCSGWFTTL